MAIIIETCPKCGHDLQDLVICTYPPIPQKKCFNCGWEWIGECKEITRVPFGGNSLEMASDNSYLNDFLKMGYSEEDSNILADLAVNSAVSYDGMLDIAEATNGLITAINNVEVEKLKDLKQGFNCRW